MAERRKIRAEFAKRYRKAPKRKKTNILDEYLQLLGKGNRKYEIFALNREGKKQMRLISFLQKVCMYSKRLVAGITSLEQRQLLTRQ